MQLGYPGSAISAYLWAPSRQLGDNDYLDTVLVYNSTVYCGAEASFARATNKADPDVIRACTSQARSVIAECRQIFPKSPVMWYHRVRKA